MSQSPDKPWIPGKQPTYDAFRIVINACQDRHGNVWSDHNFMSPADMAVARGLPQGGAPQVAHVLLTEAVRREIFMCVLLEMTKDSAFLSHWKAADDEGKAVMEVELQHASKQVITKTLEKMVPGAVAEVFAMMADQS